MPSKIQSILFNRELWDIPQATYWLQIHNKKFNKVDIKKNYLRFRQLEPNFNHYITKTILYEENKPSIELILGFL